MSEEPVIVRSPRRKRIAFLIRPEDGKLEVRAPLNVPLREITRIIEHNSEIITRLRRRFEKVSANRPVFRFEEGAEFLLLGKPYPLRFTHRVTAFDEAFLVPRGDEEAVKARLEFLYRKLTREIIAPRAAEMAQTHNLPFRTLRINSARGRWGSCSRDGGLNFSWRLIQCPEEIVDYVIAHELAHLRELNHSPRFWQVVQSLCPDYRRHDRFLRDQAPKFSGW